MTIVGVWCGLHTLEFAVWVHIKFDLLLEFSFCLNVLFITHLLGRKVQRTL